MEEKAKEMIIYEEILREFNKKKVRYILVGGIAVNIHGYMRTTADLDILLEMEDANLRKVVKILKKHGYHVKQPVDPISIADKATREDWIKNKNMKAFNFYKEDEFKEIDIIIKSSLSYDAAKKNIQRVKIGKMILPVIAIDDLIKMKQGAARDIDKIDIKMLRKIKGLKRKR
ncbi:MAG: nucleotidyltransferase family protein [Candidatus Omnitrophica bacterium]|nr:nucleotidyltransferase family protein [Candidatus Omnitrophota bacterium]